MKHLQQLLKDNNILFYKEVEEKEYDYFTIIFHKNNGHYHTPSTHPILETLSIKPFEKNGMISLNEFQFQQIKELLKLEQANVIVRITDENVN